MKKKLLYILFSLYFTSLNAQIDYGKVEYKKEKLRKVYTEDKRKNYDDALWKRLTKIESLVYEAVDNIIFSLDFNCTESLFTVQEFLEMPRDGLIKITAIGGGLGVFHNDLSKNEFYKQIDTFGDVFLVKMPNSKWETSAETKKIANYTCYKATTVTEVEGSKGITKYPITAWYCPELSFSFGPLGYSGLPGLILELENPYERYTASKIELNPKRRKKIKKPKGREVTKAAFEEIGRKAMGGFKKMY